MTKVVHSSLFFAAVFVCAGGCKPDMSALKKGTGAEGGSEEMGDNGATHAGGATTTNAGGACTVNCGGTAGGSSAEAGAGIAGSGLAGTSPTLGGSAGSAAGGSAGSVAGGSAGSAAGGSAGSAAGGSANCQVTPFVVTATPAVQYDFNAASGTVVTDSSGNSLAGKLVGTPVWSATGRLGGAITFNAANQYVELPLDVLKGLSAVSIAAWVKLSANPASSTLFDFGSNPTNHFYLRTNAGTGTNTSISFGAQVNGGAEQETVTSYTFPTGVWKHVALTVGDGTAALYIDGLKVLSRAINFAPSGLGSTAGNWIGHTHTSTASMYGSVDDFRIYGQVLEPKEVEALAPPGTDYLHFNFDEPCGNKAFDRSDLALVAALPAGANRASGFVNDAGALSLDGARQYLQLPANLFHLLRPNTTQPCNDLTVAMWVQRSSQANWERLFTFGQDRMTAMTLTPSSTALVTQFSAKLNGGDARGSIDEQLLASSSKALSPQSGIWGHVAVVLQGGTGRLYFNGQEVGTGPITIRPSDLGATILSVIGQPLYVGEPYLAANLDDLRISCRAFTPGEIRILALTGQ